jgi:hypothetical protein
LRVRHHKACAPTKRLRQAMVATQSMNRRAASDGLASTLRALSGNIEREGRSSAGLPLKTRSIADGPSMLRATCTTGASPSVGSLHRSCAIGPTGYCADGRRLARRSRLTPTDGPDADAGGRAKKSVRLQRADLAIPQFPI